ncbi:MAG TPA: hypothetical protein VK661_13435 [Planctomycetota bacterium]|nr:hypothetical protein [Planctomycetota bacterium]
MAKLMVVAAFALAFAPAADEDLDKAAAKAAEMGNYSCTITVKMEGGGGGGGEGRGIQPVELQVRSDAPWHLKSGELEAFKKGETLAVKEGEGWKKLERPQRPAEGERPDPKAMAAQMLRGLRAPHEILKDLKSASFKEVKREDSEGGRCFSGELTAEALKPFLMGGRRRGGGGGGDQAAPQATGTAKIWVNGDGAVTKYEVNVEAKRKNRDGDEVTTKSTRTVEIKDVGSTKYEVPADAAKIFEAKTVEK